MVCVRKNGDSPVIQRFLRNPWGFVPRIHGYEFGFRKSFRYLSVQGIPCHTVMYIPCCYFYSEDESFPVACCMSFIGKLSFMLAFHKHPAFGVCCRNGTFYCSTARCRIIIVLVFDGLLPQLLPFCVHFFSKPFCIDLCCLGYFLFLVLLLVRARLDVCSIHEDHLRVNHPVIQSFVQNVRKDFFGQFFRKPLAERIAHRCKMGDFVQQPIAQKPPV